MSLEDVVTSVELAQGAGFRDQVSEGDTDESYEGSEINQEQAASEEQPPPDARPLTSDAARARLDELRLKLDHMGPVNMMALEELEEAEARLKFLTEQRRDILDSIRIDREGARRDQAPVAPAVPRGLREINGNFREMFQELFGGGRGEMVLIDEEDVLESGIDIIAQPPGKRLQNVLLLSGGEKAMTAIALVLAIFKYKPSPFCILDEVDAPLDEVNVGRFIEQ